MSQDVKTKKTFLFFCQVTNQFIITTNKVSLTNKGIKRRVIRGVWRGCGSFTAWKNNFTDLVIECDISSRVGGAYCMYVMSFRVHTTETKCPEEATCSVTGSCSFCFFGGGLHVTTHRLFSMNRSIRAFCNKRSSHIIAFYGVDIANK